MQPSPDTTRELTLLEYIEQDPDITQASLASQLGVAVGTVNWHLKRLVSKGYVKVKRAQRKKLRYIITPSGVALRAKLTVEYVERSFELYRQTRHMVTKLLRKAREQGYTVVRVESMPEGPEDVLDICKLTCLEQGMQIVEKANVPTLRVQGVQITLELPEGEYERG